MSNEQVLELLEECQQSKRYHKSNSKKLMKILSGISSISDRISTALTLIDQALVHPKSNVNIHRIIDFFGLLLSIANEPVMQAFQTEVVSDLCKRLQSANKNIRERTCLLIASFLENSSVEEIELSCDLLATITEHLIIRLEDKTPAVRVAAINALTTLQDPSQKDDPVIENLLRLLSIDTSVTVRKKIVESICLCETSKVSLIQRLKDIQVTVRVAVYTRFKNETDIRQFTKEQRMKIVESGMNDREESIRMEVDKLLFKWLELLSYDIMKFLSYLSNYNEEIQNSTMLQVAFVLAERCFTNSTINNENNAIREQWNKLRDYMVSWKNGNKIGSVYSISAVDILWCYARLLYAQSFLSKFEFQQLCEKMLPEPTVFSEIVKSAVDALGGNCTEQQRHQLIFTSTLLLRLSPFLMQRGVLSSTTEKEQQVNSLLSFLWENAISNDVELPQCTLDAALQAHYSLTNELDFPPSYHDLIKSLDEQFPFRAIEVITWILQRQYLPSLSYDAEILNIVLGNLQQPSAELRELSVTCLGLLSLTNDEVCKQYYRILKQIACGDFEESIVQEAAIRAFVDLRLANKLPVHDVSPTDNDEDNDHDNSVSHDQEMSFMQQTDDDEGVPRLPKPVPISLTQELDRLLCKLISQPYQLRNSNNSSSSGSSAEGIKVMAMESAAKLVFAGYSQDEQLVSSLLKFFFIDAETATLNNNNNNNNNSEDNGNTIASHRRLTQLLSVFMHTFLACKDGCNEVMRSSISLFISDFVTTIRDGSVDSTRLTQVLKNLFGICHRVVESSLVSVNENKRKREASHGQDSLRQSLLLSQIQLQLAATACLLRELLKLNDDKIDKTLGKEIAKLVTSFFAQLLHNQEQLISSEVWEAALRSIDSVLSTIKLDNTSANALTNWKNKVIITLANKKAVTTSEDDTTTTANTAKEMTAEEGWYSCAPGLRDLLQLSGESYWDEPSIVESVRLSLGSKPSSRSRAKGQGRGQSNGQSKGPGKSRSTRVLDDVEEDDDEDASDDDDDDQSEADSDDVSEVEKDNNDNEKDNDNDNDSVANSSISSKAEEDDDDDDDDEDDEEQEEIVINVIDEGDNDHTPETVNALASSVEEPAVDEETSVSTGQRSKTTMKKPSAIAASKVSAVKGKTAATTKTSATTTTTAALAKKQDEAKRPNPSTVRSRTTATKPVTTTSTVAASKAKTTVTDELPASQARRALSKEYTSTKFAEVEKKSSTASSTASTTATGKPRKTLSSR